ncbi:MAG: methyltransferase domain-containing protein [Azoarcus sp.]|nr:methyltransferase domain-containing protein [Azoarcus sp.]
MVAILGFTKPRITAAVQDMYSLVAADPKGLFHFPVGRPIALALGYDPASLDRVPDAVVERFAGVGCPFRADAIRRGDTVLDLGCGAGTDSLLASERVGPDGRVLALDLTPEMLHALDAAAREAGAGNLVTMEADAEHIPLPDHSVDVVTSNGALNLVPDKRRAVAEMFRVLRPDGRVQVADIVISRPVPVGGRSDPALWAECVVGAAIDEDYLDLFRENGFRDIEVLREFDYFRHSSSAETRRIAQTLGGRTVEIAMRRPARPEAVPATSALMRRLHPKRLSRIGSRGLWGAIAAGASLLACYGTLAIVALLSLFGIRLAIDEGLWAFAIAAPALLAAMATAANLHRHRDPWPLTLSVLANALIAYALFVDYHAAIEGAGFLALTAAIALDIRAVYLAECVPRPRPSARAATRPVA